MADCLAKYAADGGDDRLDDVAALRVATTEYERITTDGQDAGHAHQTATSPLQHVQPVSPHSMGVG